VAGVLDELRARFGIAPGAEITMEMDPGTFTAEDAAGCCSFFFFITLEPRVEWYKSL